MALRLPPLPGISPSIVHNIPKDWDRAWYHRHVRDFLQWGDIRNATAGSGISIQTSGLNSPPTIALKGTVFTGTVALAKLTGGGSNGSMTFSAGVLTAYTPPT